MQLFFKLFPLSGFCSHLSTVEVETIVQNGRKTTFAVVSASFLLRVDCDDIWLHLVTTKSMSNV